MPQPVKINISMKYTFLILFALLAATKKSAAQLPSAFKNQASYQVEKDSRVRLYLTPQRIVWQSDTTGRYIVNAKNLLKPGNGQAELVNKDLVALKSDGLNKPGILLDYGKEIHGGNREDQTYKAG